MSKTMEFEKKFISDYTGFISEIGKLFTSRTDFDDLLKNIMNLVADNLRIKRGFISIYNEDNNRISIDASYGYTPEEISRGTYKAGEGVTGTVISTGEPIVISSLKNDRLFLNRTGAAGSDGMDDTGFICVPVKTGSVVIGTISIEKKSDNAENFIDDLNILSVISVMIAHALNERRIMLEREEELKEENRLLRIRLSKAKKPHNIIGNSAAMDELYEKIQLVAATNTTVLINGETGTGKELIADAIQSQSTRKDKPYIKVNIAALPDNLIESELFGHEKGAFTGALNVKKGRFELANGGTIFLDEIGDLKLPLQVKLLRILQEKSIERIGGTRTIPLDVRVITATHQDLEMKIEKGEFRQDLYYRLNVFPLYSPALRDRKADIMLLSDYFLEKYNAEFNKQIKRISSEAIDMLMSYHWPGNVRELENCIQRAVILNTEDVMRSYHLPPSLQMAEVTEQGADSLDALMDRYLKEIIVDNLKISRGNITLAAKQLGTTKRILSYKINKLGIDYAKYRQKNN